MKVWTQIPTVSYIIDNDLHPVPGRCRLPSIFFAALRIVIFFVLWIAASTNAYPEPLPGQIVADKSNPAFLKYHKGGSYFLAGPGDPEGFLYRGTRQHDGTRKGDQLKLIDKLKGTGANSIYIQIIRSHGGDGDATQNPFVDNDPAKGLNSAVLNQWSHWFKEMDRHGITIYLFFYDDGARVWNTGDEVSSKERAFLRTIVNRFEGIKKLVWVIAEEYDEAYTSSRISNIAAEIKAADDHNHLVAVHKQPGIDFSEFASDPSIDQFAIQLKSTNVDQLHRQVVDAWVRASNRYSINMAEAPDWGSGSQARHKAWAVAMGGAHVMVYQMFIDDTPVSDLEDLGRLVDFMESTNFGELQPRDDLAYRGTDYVLASPGEAYIAYARNSSGNIGLRDMRAGTYDFIWYDPKDGSRIVQNNVRVGAGDQAWPRPAGIGTEAALYITRKGNTQRIGSRISRTYPSDTWEFRDPIELGLKKSKLDELAAQAEGSGCVVRHGFMAYCWGRSHDRGDWASAGKPVLSTLLFFAIAEGLVSGIDDPIGNWDWQLTEADRDITFRHLANMTSGYARGEPPGARWAYNDVAVNLYGLTLKRVFNSDLDQVALNRLAALQFEDGSIFGSRDGIGVDASIRDFARIGWFWLNNGNWNGTQLLPKRLFDDYVRPHVSSDVRVSTKDGNDYLRVGSFGGNSNQTKHGPAFYGFNWWFNSHKSATGPRFWPSAPDDTYQANGHWGREVVIVIPSLDIVVAAKGNWGTQISFQPGNQDGAMNRNLQLLEQAVVDRKVPLNRAALTHSTNIVTH